jgi:hypothetical protein
VPYSQTEFTAILPFPNFCHILDARLLISSETSNIRKVYVMNTLIGSDRLITF